MCVHTREMGARVYCILEHVYTTVLQVNYISLEAGLFVAIRITSTAQDVFCHCDMTVVMAFPFI